MRVEGLVATMTPTDLPACISHDVLPPWLRAIVEEEGRLTLTDYEAARLLGISRGSVRAAIAENEIHVVRLGRRMLIPVVPLLSLIGLSLPNPTRQEDPLRRED